MMMSPLEMTRNYLDSVLSYPVTVSVPDERPDIFYVVYVADPGEAPPPFQMPTMGLEVWAPTKAEADRLIREAYEVIANAPASAGVSFSPYGSYFQPFPFDGTHQTQEFNFIVSAM